MQRERSRIDHDLPKEDINPNTNLNSPTLPIYHPVMTGTLHSAQWPSTPMASTSLKRSAPDDLTDPSHPTKRPRSSPEIVTKHHSISVRQPGAELLLEGPQDPAAIEQDLTRAICIALFAAGFESARADALQGLLEATGECSCTQDACRYADVHDKD